MILKDGVVQRGLHACIFCGSGKLFVVSGQFVTDGEGLVVFGKLAEIRLIGQLLSPCLHGEVGLAVGKNRLGRVAVLYDKVTGVARQAYIG